jgi:hypothetical protein
MAIIDKDKTLLENYYRSELIKKLRILNDALLLYKDIAIQMDAELNNLRNQSVSLQEPPKKRSLLDFVKWR